MNTTFKGKKWTQANYSRICKDWFMSWMLHEKNVEREQSERIWHKKLTEFGFINDLMTEYSNNPVRPSKKFEKFLELSS